MHKLHYLDEHGFTLHHSLKIKLFAIKELPLSFNVQNSYLERGEEK